MLYVGKFAELVRRLEHEIWIHEKAKNAVEGVSQAPSCFITDIRGEENDRWL